MEAGAEFRLCRAGGRSTSTAGSCQPLLMLTQERYAAAHRAHAQGGRRDAERGSAIAPTRSPTASAPGCSFAPCSSPPSCDSAGSFNRLDRLPDFDWRPFLEGTRRASRRCSATRRPPPWWAVGPFFVPYRGLGPAGFNATEGGRFFCRHRSEPPSRTSSTSRRPSRPVMSEVWGPFLTLPAPSWRPGMSLGSAAGAPGVARGWAA